MVLMQINSSSSVLRCYNGMALAKMHRHADASVYLKEAIKADPQNPLARFELASVLVTAGLLDEALHELLTLKARPLCAYHLYSWHEYLSRRCIKSEVLRALSGLPAIFILPPANPSVLRSHTDSTLRFLFLNSCAEHSLDPATASEALAGICTLASCAL